MQVLLGQSGNSEEAHLRLMIAAERQRIAAKRQMNNSNYYNPSAPFSTSGAITVRTKLDRNAAQVTVPKPATGGIVARFKGALSALRRL